MHMLTETVVVAIISLIGTLGGAYAGVRRANSLTNYKIDELTRRVDKHNQVVERTYKLEERVTVLEKTREEQKNEG